MSETYLCTDCPERCILTPDNVTCSKWKDRVWLHRNEIICRFCKDLTQSCPDCTRVPHKDTLEQNDWKGQSARLYAGYIERKGKSKGQSINFRGV